MAIRVRMQGRRTLSAKLGALSPAGRKVMIEGLTRTAKKTQRSARALAPKSPGGGAGAAAIDVHAKPELLGADVIGAHERTGFYMAFQEFGTAHHRAQPFLRPAFRINRKSAVSALRRLAKKAMKTVAT